MGKGPADLLARSRCEGIPGLVGPTAENPAVGFRRSVPLFEEERGLRSHALVVKVPDPAWMRQVSPGTAFTPTIAKARPFVPYNPMGGRWTQSGYRRAFLKTYQSRETVRAVFDADPPSGMAAKAIQVDCIWGVWRLAPPAGGTGEKRRWLELRGCFLLICAGKRASGGSFRGSRG